ncbi:MAG: phosphotransferase family protein [Longimicrobiaceae bacterium]
MKKTIPLEPDTAAPDSLDSDARARIEALAGERVVAARRVTAGYNATERWLVRFASGRGAFAKIGTPPRSHRHLRDEQAVYARLALACMPAVLGWEDHADRPILLLADLSSWTWPPPWTDGLAAALRAIEEIHAARAGLSSYEAKHGPGGADGWWASLERDPEPFLRLGVVTREWWRRAGPVLREAAGHVSPEGESVCHFDLRSDNLCLREGRAMVVDWSHACLGNPRVDLGLFLPGVAAEGGPSPGELMPGAPAVAAWVAGFFAHFASKPSIPGAPRVREMQRVHLTAALAWASDELGL